MRRLITIIGLEIYALLLACMQLANGVRTDEAKYLLSIPYPHPPFARTLIGLFDGWAWQEPFMRLLFATLFVQAVWFVWDMSRGLSNVTRVSLSIIWLTSAAIVLQAGTVMMAPLTALSALVFLWMLSLPDARRLSSATVGFLWLAALFTGLQGVLLLPIAVALLRRLRVSWWGIVLYVGVPMVLLGLYAFTNPLLLASLFIQVGKDAGDTILDRALGTLMIVGIGGSGIAIFLGVVGLAWNRSWPALLSFALIVLYIFVGRFDYYAILMPPFAIAGLVPFLRRWHVFAPRLVIAHLIATCFIFAWVPLVHERSPARDTLAAIDRSGVILLNGTAGHEWQYEALPGQEIRRYDDALIADATAVVCARECTPVGDDWIEIPSRTLWVWVRR